MRYKLGCFYDNNMELKTVMKVEKMDDECYLMDRYNFSIVYDEASKTLQMIDDINNKPVLVVTESGKIGITITGCKGAPWFFDERVVKFISNICRTTFGKTVLFVKRFKKKRLYIYPDAEWWVNWDKDPRVEKYVLDEQDLTKGGVVVLDMNTMKVLHGATEQKITSNKRKQLVNENGEPIVKKKKEKETVW